MLTNFIWESIHKDSDRETWRAEVFGGWLIRHHEFRDFDEGAELFGFTFVPDPNKEWKIDNV